MKRLLCLGALLGFAAGCNAQAFNRIADVAIIDTNTGAALTPYYSRGEYWVAGKAGSRYAIEIRNRLGERLLAVISVDGINVLSGATAAWDQEGYVFGGTQRYQIAGWRKSDAEVAAFTFGESSDSYAGRTGRPGNIGVIGVALFRERPPQPVYGEPMIGNSAEDASKSSQASDAQARRAESAPGVSAVAPPLAKLGTGHGAREYSYVEHTDFLRQQSQPNQVIRIHYDSLDNLLAMGIVKRPRPMPPSTNPFPGSPASGYVPDPPGGYLAE
jgi:hypothetical protein